MNHFHDITNAEILAAPLLPTLARWFNTKRRRHDDHDGWTEKWIKKLAHTGPVTQFAYGTNTRSTWPGRFWYCQMCTWVSKTIAADVDGPEFASTRTARFISREQAFTFQDESSEFHYHALIDARLVPASDWPGQGPIAGGDIKSAGFIPMPGSGHWSGGRYELAHNPAVIVPATPALMAAMIADRADEDARRRALGMHTGSGGNGGGGGQGHDGQVAATVLGNILRGMDKEQCYAEWLKVAIPADPADPFEREDFERHYGDERRGALAKANAIRAAERAGMPEMMAWATRVTPARVRVGRVRRPGARP